MIDPQPGDTVTWVHKWWNPEDTLEGVVSLVDDDGFVARTERFGYPVWALNSRITSINGVEVKK